MFNNILKNTSWLFFAEVVNKAVFFLTTLIIARVFGVSAYGQFNTALSFVMIFSIFADSGINNVVIRDIARDKSLVVKYIGDGLLIKHFLSVLTIILIILVTLILKMPYTVNIFIYLLAFYVIANSYNTFLKSTYRAFEKMHFEAVSKIIESIVFIIYMLIAAFYFNSLLLIIFGFFISSLITIIISFYYLKKVFNISSYNFNIRSARTLLKESWPFALINICMVVYFNSDTVMISFIRNDVETGLYSVAYNFVFVAALIPGLLNNSLYPALSKRFNSITNERNNIKKYVYILLSMSIILSAILFLFANYFIYFFYGAEFSGSINILKILIFSFPFLFFSSFMGVVLSANNMQKINLIITFVSILTNVILNLILIKLYGAIGASIASVIAIVLMAIMCLPYYLKYIKKNEVER